MSNHSDLQSLFRRLWESACKDAPERPSCKVAGGHFVMTITGNRDNWTKLCALNGVPPHAAQTVEGDVLTCTWPSHADAIFGEGGLMAQAKADYEVRRPQLHMARIVQRAIEMKDVAAIEAGTGTGKSYAYAAICMAMGKTVVISTSNKALQTQLYTKDIPFLQTLFPGHTVALALGKGNYACRDKVESDGLFSTALDDKQLEEWYWWTETGNLEEVPFPLTRESYLAVALDDDCTGRKCQFFATCFYYQARDKRFEADVVICNHALLCQHTITGHLLPEWDVLVVDEAHNIVADMRKASGVEMLVGSFHRTVALAAPYVASETLQFADALVEKFGVEVMSGERTPGEMEVEVQPGRQFTHGVTLRTALLDLSELVATSDAGDPQMQKKREKRSERIANAAYKLFSFLTHDDERTRWIAFQGDKIALHSMPVYVGDVLAQLAVGADGERVPVVYCSATLATPDLAPFMESIGAPDALQLIAKSPFDYASNALLYIPRGSEPAPSDKEVGRFLYEQIMGLVGASKGGAFILFTSRRQMDSMYALCSQEIQKRLKLRVLHQEPRANRQELIRQFKADGNAVLFATRSFFEGVDITGSALRLVILDKLPFDAPGPLTNAIDRRLGSRAFHDRQMPDMLIVLKQAVGRLIRTNTDKGVIAVLDSRIRAKWNRRVFGSLPDAPSTWEIGDVRTFYDPRLALPAEPMPEQIMMFAPATRYGG